MYNGGVMKQQCNISFVYSSLAILVGGIAYFLIRGLYLQIILWVLFIILVVWLYDRVFPVISRYMGYGPVDDEWVNKLDQTPVKVILYTGMGCPFSPIVRKRLKELQPRMDFVLKEVNITLKPYTVISKRIRALPVLEVEKFQLVGNATSEELVRFIMDASIPQNVRMERNGILQLH